MRGNSCAGWKAAIRGATERRQIEAHEAARVPAGEFVGLGWRMQGLWVPCNGTDKFEIDMAAAVVTLGGARPMRAFMLAQMCERRGQKLSLYD
jgi:hypothetical protein